MNFRHFKSNGSVSVAPIIKEMRLNILFFLINHINLI